MHKTEQGEWRTTRSLVLPNAVVTGPPAPLAPMTMTSAPLAFAVSMISWSAFPASDNEVNPSSVNLFQSTGSPELVESLLYAGLHSLDCFDGVYILLFTEVEGANRL